MSKSPIRLKKEKLILPIIILLLIGPFFVPYIVHKVKIYRIGRSYSKVIIPQEFELTKKEKFTPSSVAPLFNDPYIVYEYNSPFDREKTRNLFLDSLSRNGIKLVYGCERLDNNGGYDCYAEGNNLQLSISIQSSSQISIHAEDKR